jgi:hypothetical protein
MTPAQLEMIRHADEIYYPCAFGVHVCGSDDERNEAITIANIAARNADEARRVFAACKAEAEAAGDEPHDFVVDLNLGRHEAQVEDFWLSRQMLERCLAAGRTALLAKES